MSDFVYAIFSLILLTVPQSILLAVPPSILLAVPQSRTQGTLMCHDIANESVFTDPSCAGGGLGCNAGGQGQLCRFCGFSPFPNCPDAGPKVQTESTMCHDIAKERVFADPSCAGGGLGCNAGGQGQLCRFCGFSPFPNCPDAVMKVQTERPQYYCNDVSGSCATCSGNTGIGCDGAMFTTFTNCERSCKRAQYHCDDSSGSCTKCSGNSGIGCNGANFPAFTDCERSCKGAQYHCDDSSGSCSKCGRNTGIGCNAAKFPAFTNCERSCKRAQYHCNDSTDSCSKCSGNTGIGCNGAKFSTFADCERSCKATQSWHCNDASRCALCGPSTTSACVGKTYPTEITCISGFCETDQWVCSGDGGSRHCVRCGFTTETRCPLDSNTFSDQAICDEFCESVALISPVDE